MIEKLKQRWGIKRNIDFWLIMLVFSLSGSSVLYVRKFLFGIMNISTDTVPTLVYILLYIVLMVPSYYVLALFYGFIFGQFDFFLAFAKRTWGRMLPSGRKKVKE